MIPSVGLAFDQCPKAWLAIEAGPEAEMVRDVERLQRHGAMPVAGGVLDQAPHFLAAIDIVESELAVVAKLMKGGADDR